MAYYKVCHHCGAHLDSNEVCDCRKSRMREAYDLLVRLTDEQLDRIIQAWEKDTALDAANTESGVVEHGLAANVSASIITRSEN